MIDVKLAPKRSIFLFLAFVLFHSVGIGQNAGSAYRMRTIVIDAGHGGNDPGNLGTGRYKTKEKDIALDVALRVGKYIKESFPDIKVVYTRDKDVFIGLNERAEAANKVKADLFLSIHCNAAKSTSAMGVETFALGLHRTEENLEVAMKENSAIFLEDDYQTKYEGFDPNSPESIVALTLMQSAYLQQSLAISSYVQKQFKERVGRKDRGVKQAGFLVLRKTTMPSILIELGFLTNATEEDFLNSEDGKTFMASAIFRGFKEYKEMVEDPIPAGTTPEKKPEPKPEPKPDPKFEAEKTKQDSIAKAKADFLERAKQYRLKLQADSIAKANEQAKLKSKSDSLQQAKAKLIEEKRQKEEALKKQEEEKQVQLQAQADSLERVKAELLEAKKKREEELIAQNKKEQEAAKLAAEQKAAEDRKRKEEEAKKLEESKQQAVAILEEIKAQKERDLEEARKQKEVEAEKQRLEEVRKQKEVELAEKQRLEKEQAGKAKAELAAIAKARQDSISRVESAKKEQEAARMKQQQKASADLTIDNKKPTSPEEAELLYLQLRKKELEQRIAQLTGQPASTSTTEITMPAASNGTSSGKTEVASSDMKGEAGVVFRVQILTSPTPLRKDSPDFKGQRVAEYQQDGLYKYTAGVTHSFDEITKLQADLRNLGFKGAFVVAFKDGERIKVADARELLKQ